MFWGVEADLRKLEGINDTSVGYMDGHLKDPSYEDVLPYKKLFKAFSELHNPSTIPGTIYKYRTSIFFHTSEQREIAEGFVKELKMLNFYVYQVKTTVVKAGIFYRGEEYHQRYYEKLGR